MTRKPTWGRIKKNVPFDTLANKCESITGIYPASWNQLKNAMRGYDKSLLANLT